MESSETILERMQAVLVAARAPARFLDAWPKTCPLPIVAPTRLTVLRWFEGAVELAPPGPFAALAHALRHTCPALAWRQTYLRGEVDDRFLGRYGWCEIVGPAGQIHGRARAAGVLLLGPETEYPAHHHAAEELYVPLSGAAEWQQGGGPFAVRQPGDCIVHEANELHAMRTGEAALLALYVWNGPGLGEPARIDPPTAARH